LVLTSLAVRCAAAVVLPFVCEPDGFEIDNLYLDMNGIIHPVRSSSPAVAAAHDVSCTDWKGADLLFVCVVRRPFHFSAVTLRMESSPTAKKT
jgi:hypothetical protein